MLQGVILSFKIIITIIIIIIIIKMRATLMRVSNGKNLIFSGLLHLCNN